MSEDQIRELWKDIAPSLGAAGSRVRLASARVQAARLVNPPRGPSGPTQMLSNATVYDGWRSSRNHHRAEQLLQDNPRQSLRALQRTLLEHLVEADEWLPYIWWVYAFRRRRRAIHEDSQRQVFVKLDNVWQPVYPIMAAGALVGAQGATGGYEAVPNRGYFLLYENEQIALRGHR